jgi:hypothetical protein
MFCSWVFLPNWADSWSECIVQVMWIWSWTRISNPITCQESYFNKRNDPCPPTLHQCGKKSQVNKHNNCRHRVIKVPVSCVLLPKWTDSWGECIVQVMSVWSWTRISNPRTCPLSYLTRGLTHVYPHCMVHHMTCRKKHDDGIGNVSTYRSRWCYSWYW